MGGGPTGTGWSVLGGLLLCQDWPRDQAEFLSLKKVNHIHSAFAVQASSTHRQKRTFLQQDTHVPVKQTR